MDNIEWDMRSPQEDEFALCAATGLSPCMGWAFPRMRDHYDRYLTFRGVPASEIARWQAAFVRFLKKLTWKYRCPLVLKSPPHSCRIGLLLQMFPRARFVHIHRDPYDVFRSSRLMFQVVFEMHRVQRRRVDDLDDWILRQYREMYDAFFEERGLIPEGQFLVAVIGRFLGRAFFEERGLIPEGQFHEVGYEELEKDPVGQVRRIYEALNLPEFGPAEPGLRR